MKAGRRSSAGASSGSGLRRSTSTNTVSATTEALPAPRTAGEVQPSAPPRISASTAAPAATVKAAAPGRSSRRAPGSRDSGSVRRASTTAASASGRFTRKIDRQPRYSVSRPPATGPTAAAAPLTEPQTPKATARSRPR